MQLIFHLDSLEFNQTIREWWKHTDHFHKIIQLLDKHGFWKTMTHAGIYGLKPFSSTEDFIEMSRHWRQENYTVQQSREDTDFIIEFGLYPEFDMSISIVSGLIKKISNDIVSETQPEIAK